MPVITDNINAMPTGNSVTEAPNILRLREELAKHTVYMHNVHSDNMVVVIDNTHAQGEY